MGQTAIRDKKTVKQREFIHLLPAGLLLVSPEPGATGSPEEINASR